MDFPIWGFAENDISADTRRQDFPGASACKIDIADAFILFSVGIQNTAGPTSSMRARPPAENRDILEEQGMQMTMEWRAPPVLSGNGFPMFPFRGERQNHERGMVPCSYLPTP